VLVRQDAVGLSRFGQGELVADDRVQDSLGEQRR
jgi:hypothetical protein